MSLGQTINLRVVKDDLRPSLERLLRLHPERITKVMGIEGSKLTRQHLRGKPANRRGWPTTRFWGRAASATSHTNTPSGATISINQIGVAQRYYGGPIRPHKKQALTIPINSKAYGKTAYDFPELFMLKFGGKAFLVQRIGKKKTLEFLFVLSRGVNQKPDPTVLPSDEAMHDRILPAVTRLVVSEYERRNK